MSNKPEHPASLVETLESRRLLSSAPPDAATLDISVGFGPASAHSRGASDQHVDAGRALAGDGVADYGWTFEGGPWRNTWAGRETRPGGPGVDDERTLGVTALGHRRGVAWEMSLPAGEYDVTVTAGGRGAVRVAAEGVVILEQDVGADSPFAVETSRVRVDDGRLTLTGDDGLAMTRLATVRVAAVSVDDPAGGNGGGGCPACGGAGCPACGGGGSASNSDSGGDSGGDQAGGGDGGGTVEPSDAVKLGPWETRRSLAWPSMEGASTVYDGKLYTWGGYDSAETFQTNPRGQVYDPAADSWTQIASLGEALTHMSATVHDNQIYIFGGFTAAPGDYGPAPTVYRYTPATDSMEVFGTMPYPVSGYAMANVDGRVYVISGMTRGERDFEAQSTRMFSIDLNDPDAGWRDEPDAPVGRDHTTAVVIDGQIYYISGQTDHEQYAGVRDDVHRYDPATREWTRLADFPDGGRGHIDDTAEVIDGKILVAGGNFNGEVNQNISADIFLYDPETDEWSLIGQMPEPRRGAYVDVIDGYLYIAGGDSNYPRNTLYRAKLL